MAGCSGPRDNASTPQDNGKVQVVATIFPLADWVKQVGGDKVQVTTLLPAGRSPHTFDPTPNEIRSIAHARVFFKVGLKMDDWGSRLAEAGGADTKVIALGDLLASRHQLPDLTSATAALEEIGAAEADEHGHDAHAEHAKHDHDHEGVNPHYWLDVQLARLSVADIRDALIAADPKSSATYTSNATAYGDRLAALDGQLRDELSSCTQRRFVSFHNAYPYLASRYNLQLAGVIEEYPGKTPSEKYVKALATRLKELGIKTVFSEPQLNPQVAEILAREVGATVDVLDPYGSDTAPDRNTYEKLLQYNAGQLRKALK
jgi:zinc transport system substrate-binding protein